MNRFFIALLLLLFVWAELPAAPVPLRITSIADGAVAPANWQYPLVEWEDGAPAATAYEVVFEAGALSFTLNASERRVVPPREKFLPLLANKTIRITVRRASPGAKASATCRVSVDPSPFADTIVYRLVEPLFNPAQDAIFNVFRLEAEKPDSHRVAESLCLGCHTFQDSSAAFNVRRDRDRRLITNFTSGDGSWKDRVLGEFSFVSFSPDGRTLAVVTGTRSTINVKKTFIDPFDMAYSSGDLALLKPGDAEPVKIPGASDPELVEDLPAWSPGGQTLAFCRYKPMPGVPRLNPVALYTIPTAGGEAKPLLKKPPSAYCYFPKFSPDGKWISFVSADASRSYFARQSSDIWLYNRTSDTIKKLECNRAAAMDSWHVWSTDSRWLVFSSNRDSSGLTALYLTRIEDSGTARPPIKLTWDGQWKANLPFIIPGTEFRFDEKAGAFLRSVFPKP